MTGVEVSRANSQEAEKMVPPVKLLVFDMGHVFVRFDWEKVCQGFCDRARVSRERFKTVLSEVAKLGYESGGCDTEYFLRRMNELLGSDISMEEFTALWNASFEEDPEMAELLQQLKESYPIYLLSNTNENHYAYLQGRYNVARHFAHLILSYEVGLAKPDTRIYQLVLERSGYAPSEIVFVDDLIPNVEAAAKVGLRTIQFVGIDDLKHRLADMGVVTGN
jgi:putative hydrolase of the HAD superfamily